MAILSQRGNAEAMRGGGKTMQAAGNGEVMFAMIRRNMARMPETEASMIVGIVFTALAGMMCLAFIGHRVWHVQNWRKLAYIQWLVLLQLIVALCFMIVSAVLRYAYDADNDIEVCQLASRACVALYTVVKGLFYLLLADRLHVARTSGDRRTRSKLYMFHYVCITAVIMTWNVVLFHFGTFTIQEGVCIVGAIRDLFITVVMIDIALNLYLTAFFLYCLSRSFRVVTGRRPSIACKPQASQLNADLRALTIRTVLGLIITLAATVTNVVAMIVMNGEAMWYCWIICKADIVVNIIVLFWITSPSAERSRRRASRTSDKANNNSQSSSPHLNPDPEFPGARPTTITTVTADGGSGLSSPSSVHSSTFEKRDGVVVFIDSFEVDKQKNGGGSKVSDGGKMGFAEFLDSEP